MTSKMGFIKFCEDCDRVTSSLRVQKKASAPCRRTCKIGADNSIEHINLRLTIKQCKQMRLLGYFMLMAGRSIVGGLSDPLSVCLSATIVHCGQTVQDRHMVTVKYLSEVCV